MRLQQVRIFLRKWAAWGLILLAGVTLITEARVARQVWKEYLTSGSVDEVTRWENRLAELKSRIPPEVERVGYLSADPQLTEFYLTQYALIPVVLEKGAAPDWMIANYPGKTIQLVLQKQLDLQQYAVESLGYGLYLVHKR